MREILESGLRELGLRPDERAVERFCGYYEYLDQRNRVMNLTAISGEEDVARLHFLDCATLCTVADFKNASVIDVGTGAGFPGLPVKILEPSVSLTLLDSLRKRVDFLSETCERLALTDVQCLHVRAEEADTSLRESYDYAVSRAVARLNVLCELCLPFVRLGGAFLAMKGPDCAEELSEAENAIRLLGGEVERVVPCTVPGIDTQHCVAVIRKVAPSPAKYPRRFAKIQKEPL